MSRLIIAVIIIGAFLGQAKAISKDCNNVEKMARCCTYYIKSINGKLRLDEQDLANQCFNEINGAIDQSREDKTQGICAPNDVTADGLAKSFIMFTENNTNYYTRSPRFGLLYLMGSKWPCNK